MFAECRVLTSLGLFMRDHSKMEIKLAKIFLVFRKIKKSFVLELMNQHPATCKRHYEKGKLGKCYGENFFRIAQRNRNLYIFSTFVFDRNERRKGKGNLREIDVNHPHHVCEN